VCDHDVDKTVARENQALTCSSTGTALYNLHPEVKKIDPIPLLSSCGQIHAEGESVLYGSNVFCIESVQDLRCFLGGRTIHQLEQIRAISLFITADLESYFSALERTMNPTWQCALIPVPHMKRLETLNVSIEHIYFGKSIDLENLGLNGWTPVPCCIRNLLRQFRLCPLKEVAISIGCAYKSKYDKNDLCYVANQRNVSNFPREMRDKLAGELKAMLLDPMGKAEELDRWEKKRAELDAKYALVNSAPDTELDDEVELEKDATENSDIESDNDGAGESEGGE
jgi:hypothetical protein